jgi:diamine N-acetyltransferase
VKGNVRSARSEDYAALCVLWKAVDDLHARLLPGYFKRSAKPPRRRDEIERILRAPDEAVFVAEIDAGGAVVGLVHVQIYDTPAIAMMVPKRRAHIDNLVVDEGHRRQRFGTRLLDAAASWARQHGAEDLLLTVWEGNDDALRFYEKAGFGPINAVLGRALR